MKSILITLGSIAFVAGVALFALSDEKPSGSFLMQEQNGIESKYLDFLA